MAPPEWLPIPTAQLVQDACHRFNAENELMETALKQLRRNFPANKKTPDVLLKVLVLNKLYSTRVDDVDVAPLAKHITQLDLDRLIKERSLMAVGRIWQCDGLRKEYYSFATKFCSWHEPSVYPIYDSRVNEALWAYKEKAGGPFEEFRRYELGEYERFVEIVKAFRSFYGLNRFSFKQLDKFLWRVGERIIRERR